MPSIVIRLDPEKLDDANLDIRYELPDVVTIDPLPTGTVDTGEIKLGSLLGDHVKTGIGLLLNTGTVVGAGSNLYGAAMPPTHVPPFSWGTGEELVEYRLDKFLEVAERSMGRRDVTMTEGQRAQLTRAWERARREGNLEAGGR